MLVRSAGRRQRQTNRLLASSFAQLNLPWLAPAQLRWSASQASLPERPSPRRRHGDAPRLRQVQAQQRQLATAASQITVSPGAEYPPPGLSNGFRNSADANVPWDRSKQQDPFRQPLSALRPYNDPIIINSTTQNPAQSIKIGHGIVGTTGELLQHLYTSLRVGRFDRAELIIQRVAAQSGSDAPEVLHAHTAYLEELLRSLASQPKGSGETVAKWKKMQTWYEVEVRAKDVEPDAKMLVVMIRGAIRAMDGTARDRELRKYVDRAQALGEEPLDDVLYAEDYDDNEFFIMGVASSELYQDEIEAPETAEAVKEEEERLHSGDAQTQRILQEPPKYQTRTDSVNMDELPEVLPTEQKGSGLASVKRAMQDFINKPPPSTDQPPEVQQSEAFERQRIMEETSVEIALERWKEADADLRKLGISTAMQKKPMAALMWQWYTVLLPALEQELKEVKKILSFQVGTKMRENEKQHYGPFLELLPMDKVAANTILWVIARIARGKDRQTGSYEHELKLNDLTTGLGKQMEAETMAEASKRKMKEEAKQQAKADAAAGMKGRTQRRLARKSNFRSANEKQKFGYGANVERMTWPLAPKVKLGAMLVQKLIESAHLPVTRKHPRTGEMITQMQPAFLHRIKYVAGKKIGVVVPNPALMEKLESEPLGAMIAKRMPMVVEPKPWSGWNVGGYLHYPTPILRLASGDKSGKDYFIAADRKNDLDQVYAGVTALGKVPWKVHPGVLRVQIDAWNSGEEIANFAPLHPNLPAPPEPDADASGGSRRQWLIQLKDIESKRAGFHSKRCFQNFQLEIARSVANETLYFPHNMDFRGRAYPIPPYLNHMGADNVRGLLVFAEGKPLGKDGLRWLKIHLATVAGHDKASMTERINFTEEHLDDIYDSVRNPLGGKRWWLEAEDAWQTLAACFELTAALDSPDPEQFISTIPIQQDGTCNGLQHYAALGGDMIGARQVNLEPGDRPADVYTAVMQAVAAEVERDAEAGNKIAQKLHGRLTRKCVKQPVMTNVYGVTFYGAREQVYRQLEALFPEVGRFDDINLMSMAQYVATKIFKSLGEMFSGAQAIQQWLGTCADRIATCLTPEQIATLTAEKLIVVQEPDEEMQEQAKKPRKARGKTTREAVAKKSDRRGKSREAGSIMSDKAMPAMAKPLFKSTVVWTTPLRLPVVQPYRKSKARAVKTGFQQIALQEPQVWDPVSKRKQLQAFPPNFIHSLDATHMLLSALKCNEEGMTFAAIHDSFWTHACDVDRLNILLRDAFVEMHSEDIVGRLKEEFETRYRGCMYLANVSAKSKVGVKISEWRKNNTEKGAGKTGELALEAERMRLMQSEDAEERDRGQAMVTPGSIMANEGDASAFLASSELAGQTLGDMPENMDYETTNSDADALFGDADEAALTEGVASGSVSNTNVEPLAEEGSEQAKEEETEDDDAASAADKNLRKKKVYERKTYVWLPMEFPEVPEKGDFDVTRLKASRYFFH